MIDEKVWNTQIQTSVGYTMREREWTERKREVGRGRRIEKVDLENEENNLCYASGCSVRLVHKSKCCNGVEVHA